MTRRFALHFAFAFNMSKNAVRFELLLIGFADQHSHELVENNGFEPLTPCLQSRCSSQLS